MVANINGLSLEPENIEGLAVQITGLVDDKRLRQKLAGHAVPVLASLIRFDEMTTSYLALFRAASLTHPRPYADAREISS